MIGWITFDDVVYSSLSLWHLLNSLCTLWRAFVSSQVHLTTYLAQIYQFVFKVSFECLCRFSLSLHVSLQSGMAMAIHARFMGNLCFFFSQEYSGIKCPISCLPQIYTSQTSGRLQLSLTMVMHLHLFTSSFTCLSLLYMCKYWPNNLTLGPMKPHPLVPNLACAKDADLCPQVTIHVAS